MRLQTFNSIRERGMNPTNLFDLKGRVAVVTGGNGGIGRSLALGFAKAGASVAIIGRNEDKNDKVLAELQKIGNPAAVLRVDLNQRDRLAPAIDEIEGQLGSIGILVNNAGIASLSGGILQESAEDWDRVIETQLNAVFLMSKLVANGMKERMAGKIINIGSMYSYFGSAVAPSYSAAKGAIVQLTKSMAIELAAYNIQVNAIAPGWFPTDLTAPVRSPELKEMNDEIIARTPAGRWGEPDELVGAAMFLASKASDFVTGAMIPVDGGYSIR
jgi:2-deoxy-D-gluconate 3-dehydrogenase